MKLHIELREKLLVATISGDVSFSRALPLLLEVCDATVDQEADKVLIDCLAVEGELSNLERYTIGVEVTEYLRQRSIRPMVAVLGKPPTINGFGVLVGQNRGAKAEVFSELQDALKWLNQASARPATPDPG
jgi:hypothetical protein